MRCALVPFQSVVHDLLPRRSHDASRNAVYQAMIAWGARVGRARWCDVTDGRSIGCVSTAFLASAGRCFHAACRRFGVASRCELTATGSHCEG